MIWHWQVKEDDKVLGPYSDALLKTLVRTGRIQHNTLIRFDDKSIWVLACQIPGLFSDVPQTTTPSPDADSPEDHAPCLRLGQDANPRQPEFDPDSSSESGNVMIRRWQVKEDDNVLGPYSDALLKTLVRTGRIQRNTLVRSDGKWIWVLACTIPGLFSDVPQTTSPSPEPDAPVDFESQPNWHIGRDGKTSGPFSLRQLFDLVESGWLRPADLLWKPGQPEWFPASQVKELFVNESEDHAPRQRVGQHTNSGEPEFNSDLGGLVDSDRDAVRDSLSSLKPSRPSAPREPEKRPATRGEPSPSEWNKALERAVKMEHTAKVVRQKPVDDAAAQPVKEAPRREALVRRRGFQHGYQLLTIVYLINACLVCCLVPAVCMIFFSRLLLLSASVFAPFEGGNDLQGGQLVECGLSALSLLVLIGFPVWHLISNDGALWHYVPSALLGMTVGFGLSPDYLDEVCAALQWCEFGFGIAAVGLTVHTLFLVPARSRMSLSMIAAGLLTALSAMALFCVRSGSMLSVQADAIPPQFRGALPDAPLYVFGLYGTLVFIPGAILFELYRHTALSTRQFIIRTGVLLGIYLLAGSATLGAFVNGAGSGFFDVPLALLPLGCINAVAAAIPSALLLVDPQFSVSQD